MLAGRIHPCVGAFDEGDVVSPVKTEQFSIKETLEAGDHRFVGDDHDSERIQTAANPLA